MKKLLCLLCAFMMMAAMACAESPDLSAMSVEELQDLRDRISLELAARSSSDQGEYILEFNGDRGWLGLRSYDVFENKGDLYLGLTVDYLNNTESVQNFSSACWTKAFQSGLGLEHPFYSDKNAPSSLQDLKPGVKMDGYRVFFTLIDRAPTMEFTLYNGLNMRNPDEHTVELELKYPD